MTKTLSFPRSHRPDPAAVPAGLGAHGRALWEEVQREYGIVDVGGREVLFQVCMAVDMAFRLREEVDSEGLVIKTATGTRENPLIKQELAHRAFICRGLQKLGLSLEPIRPVGRPLPGCA